ncbi:hypothetical protein F383_37255 [Gossypium arboreum]|uniref:Uncharacterized protein n=1 Tax=Gossypium arboreum TaxID=29729 RepID=A0A0B0MBL6_GOSAR|nr:hypothetical protein F383_37255 [Gossypium arboreum]
MPYFNIYIFKSTKIRFNIASISIKQYKHTQISHIQINISFTANKHHQIIYTS